MKLSNLLIMLFYLGLTGTGLMASEKAGRAGEGEKGVDKILELVFRHSNSLQAARQFQAASGHRRDASGYLPDPTIAVNVFASPLETRNGPQRANIMLTQPVSWPVALEAEEQMATAEAHLMDGQKELLLLDISYRVRVLVYRYTELTQKLENKDRMIAGFGDLSRVVLGKVRFGGAGQAEVSRIAIESLKLHQEIRRLKALQVDTVQQLTNLSGGKPVAHLLPGFIDDAWGELEVPDPDQVDLSGHPLLRLARAKIQTGQAGIQQAKARRLPKLGLSVTWFQIDRSAERMPGTNPGRDAYAVGLSASVPVWGQKYSSEERASLMQHSAAESELKQRELELRTGIRSTHEELKATDDILTMYSHAILPQASQALKSDQESFTQGGASFEKIIENHLRIVGIEDQIVETKIKKATLTAALEKLLGTDRPEHRIGRKP